jgi:hypothetical protein
MALAEERERQAVAARDAVRDAITPPLASTWEVQQIWDAQRNWDAQGGGAKLASAVYHTIAAATDAELAVIMPEVEPYCRAKGVDTSFVKPVLEQRVPLLAEAERQAQLGSQGRQVVEYRVRAVKNGIERNSPAMHLPEVGDCDPDVPPQTSSG